MNTAKFFLIIAAVASNLVSAASSGAPLVADASMTVTPVYDHTSATSPTGVTTVAAPPVVGVAKIVDEHLPGNPTITRQVTTYTRMGNNCCFASIGFVPASGKRKANCVCPMKKRQLKKSTKQIKKTNALNKLANKLNNVTQRRRLRRRRRTFVQKTGVQLKKISKTLRRRTRRRLQKQKCACAAINVPTIIKKPKINKCSCLNGMRLRRRRRRNGLSSLVIPKLNV